MALSRQARDLALQMAQEANLDEDDETLLLRWEDTVDEQLLEEAAKGDEEAIIEIRRQMGLEIHQGRRTDQFNEE